MTDDFAAGVDWLMKMQNVFSYAETRLIWALIKADGRVVQNDELEQAVTGRKFSCSNLLKVHVNRARVRARGLGLEIITVRGVGYRIDIQPGSSFYSGARAVSDQEVAA